MSERYWITGAQLGMLIGLIKILKEKSNKKEIIKEIDSVLQNIQNEQFIGNMPEPYEDYEIVIRKKRKEDIKPK